MISSASQSSESLVRRKGFGYCYAACQVINGIISSIFDVRPPKHLLEQIDKQSDYVKDWIESIARKKERVGWAVQYPKLSYLPIVIGLLTQGCFGTPSGDIEYQKFFSHEPGTPSDWSDGIWVYQWLLLLFSTVSTCCNWSSDTAITVQAGAELLHLGVFIICNEDDKRSRVPQEWNSINWAYIFDPLKGIAQIGRTEWCIDLTEGYSYIAVPVMDIIFQFSYAGFYSSGINKLAE